MRTPCRFLLIVLFLLPAILGGWNGVQAQAGYEYFDETGHSVSGEFLSFYRSVPNPELVYGYPITEPFADTVTGFQVQYFQKARFELHLAEPAAQRVQLTRLGFELYEPGQPELELSGAAGCRAFANTSYQVCYTFLDFYDQHGGAAQFGLPVSNMELHNSVTVQYFERARFEWRPGLDGSSTVALTDVGWMYFYERQENPERLRPVPNNSGIESVKRLQARAFPASAVTARRGAQTIYVLVQDQRSVPVEGVRVNITLHLPSGEVLSGLPSGTTDENGIARIPVSYNSAGVGMARIEVEAARDEITARTFTSFRVWW